MAQSKIIMKVTFVKHRINDLDLRSTKLKSNARKSDLKYNVDEHEESLEIGLIYLHRPFCHRFLVYLSEIGNCSFVL